MTPMTTFSLAAAARALCWAMMAKVLKTDAEVVTN